MDLEVVATGAGVDPLCFAVVVDTGPEVGTLVFMLIDAGDVVSDVDLSLVGMPWLAEKSTPFLGTTVPLPTLVPVALSGFDVSAHGADCAPSIGLVFTHPTDGTRIPKCHP